MRMTGTLNLLLFLVLISGCLPQPAGPNQASSRLSSQPVEDRKITLTVLAAASLTEAFKELAQPFETAHPGVSLIFNFAGSQQLAQQLANGAPADVFASANQKQMNAAIEVGRVEPGAAQPFVHNRLVIIYSRENAVQLKDLKDLAMPGLKLVVASREVPVGQYSLDFLEKAAADPALGERYRDAVKGNIVSYEDNVRAVLTKVALGEADGGIVYSSDVTAASTADVGQIEIPSPLNVTADYPIAALRDSPNPAAAEAFVDFVLSPSGQQIMAKYGFIPVSGK